MGKQQESQFRLMTYNIGGGRKDFGSLLGDVIEVVREASPDILVIQEAVELQDADGVWHSALDQIAQAIESGKHTYFGATVSMREHMHVQQPLFVHGIFSDWQDWRTGNAILSRWEFVRLGDPLKPGVPRNVPLYQTPLYQGNRDTEPRYALIARINKPPIFPFVVGVHFTTLVAEREQERGSCPFLGRVEEAQLLRFKQARRLLDLLREHVLERGEVIFLLGDFNAVASEPCIASVLETEGGFVRLTPAKGPDATHPKVFGRIDHIFVYPRDRLVGYQCWVVNSPTARRASDHLPVVADVKVR
ncbi:MAG: endonuclease/exonuclease/phosphatase family protein [Anaerolineae bacterium]